MRWRGIEKLPDDVLAAIEVALPGQTIRMLSNPVRDCNSARTGCRADADCHADCEKPDRKAKCGRFKNTGRQYPGKSSSRRKDLSPCRSGRTSVNLDEGAEKIMQVVSDAGTIYDMDQEQPDTNVGNMFSRIKQGMENLDETAKREIHITDILAVIRWHRF